MNSEKLKNKLSHEEKNKIKHIIAEFHLDNASESNITATENSEYSTTTNSTIKDKSTMEYVKYLLDGSGMENRINYSELRKELEKTNNNQHYEETSNNSIYTNNEQMKKNLIKKDKMRNDRQSETEVKDTEQDISIFNEKINNYQNERNQFLNKLGQYENEILKLKNELLKMKVDYKSLQTNNDQLQNSLYEINCINNTNSNILRTLKNNYSNYSDSNITNISDYNNYNSDNENFVKESKINKNNEQKITLENLQDLMAKLSKKLENLKNDNEILKLKLLSSNQIQNERNKEKEVISTRKLIGKDKKEWKSKKDLLSQYSDEDCRNILYMIGSHLMIDNFNNIEENLNNVELTLNLVPQMQKFISDIDKIVWEKSNNSCNIPHKLNETLGEIENWSAIVNKKK